MSELICYDRYRFAYVDFKTRRFQKLGVRLSEKMIDGRRLLIKYGECIGVPVVTNVA